MLERMIDKRPQADRLLVAEIYGEARRRARWRELDGEEEAAAVAGILEGAREGEPDEPLARQAAMLCRQAGAGPAATPAWIREGRRRRAAAKSPPFPGGLHGGGTQRLRHRDGHVLADVTRKQQLCLASLSRWRVRLLLVRVPGGEPVL